MHVLFHLTSVHTPIGFVKQLMYCSVILTIHGLDRIEKINKKFELLKI
jgi:hypothetical protein